MGCYTAAVLRSQRSSASLRLGWRLGADPCTRLPRHFVVAVGSLCSAALTTGCLIEAPPEFEPTEKTAPVVRHVDPPTSEYLHVERPATIPLSITFSSPAHAGKILVRLWANFNLGPREELMHLAVSGGGPDQHLTIAAATTKVAKLQPGCVPLTALLFYQDDFDHSTDKPTQEAFEANRVTELRWWMVVDQDPQDVSISDCHDAVNQLDEGLNAD